MSYVTPYHDLLLCIMQFGTVVHLLDGHWCHCHHHINANFVNRPRSSWWKVFCALQRKQLLQRKCIACGMLNNKRGFHVISHWQDITMMYNMGLVVVKNKWDWGWWGGLVIKTRTHAQMLRTMLSRSNPLDPPNMWNKQCVQIETILGRFEDVNFIFQMEKGLKIFN